MTFEDAFYHTPHRRSIKFPHYLPLYERYLHPFQGATVTALEIGVGDGGFLQVLQTYLGPQARVLGLDCSGPSDETVMHGRQEEAETLARVKDAAPTLSIVIDDGSHQSAHQRASFETLFPHLQSPGVYLVEDIQYSYSRKYTGYRHPESFSEYLKGLGDELNAMLVDPPEDLRPTEFTRTGYGVHWYPNLVVIEKSRHDLRSPVHVGQRDVH